MHCLYSLAMPDVITKDITPDHEFIILACDGESYNSDTCCKPNARVKLRGYPQWGLYNKDKEEHSPRLFQGSENK